MPTKKKAAASTETTSTPTRKRKAPAPKEGGADNRRHPRVPLDVLVQLRSDSVDAFRAMHARNLSIGGMFIATKEKRPQGAEIFFQFTVKDGGTLIEGLGRVVHVSDDGIGVEFVSVLEPSASIIRALVDERLRVA